MFGLAGVVGGVVVAAAGAPRAAELLVAAEWMRPAVARPVALVGLFVATVLAANVVGFVADRLVRALLLGGLNRAAGGVFGIAKGAALLGFGLLLLEHWLPSSSLTAAVKTSALGRPLAEFATHVFSAGRALSAASEKAA